MFTITQLAGFVAVAEEGHFGRAATRLNMTQPPLSRQIQQLERELQVRLIDRSSRTVRLTPAGRSFLTDARRLLHDAENAARSVRRVTDGRTGVLRLGFTATSAYGVLGGLINTARQHLPHVEVVLHELVSGDQLERISADALDLGLVRPPTPPGLESRSLRSEPLVAALPVEHPLTERDEIDLSAFHGEKVVGYSPFAARYFYDLLVGLFGEAGVHPSYVQHADQVHTVLALVEVGLGIALVPSTAARLRFEGVVLRPVRLPVPDPVELHLAWRGSNDNPVLHTFLELL
ncbi:LysR substrate-binding domain-containing protein [Saccharopolyspora mangrovi]|uniref:LysR substrate-binding domain-containing protein n=1 Tax=Saccharopolyspora mangrovi TaxID=3082379 RepID=A0ABU6AJ21_9PSEU|nr:LysR substrate-binding domain-containing protein [Saccharopolyspora sp. S2-29]MEB3371462.1 LysR substrate-binding domain-containing protein [Saccharopolyspora sp. S2-29]